MIWWSQLSFPVLLYPNSLRIKRNCIQTSDKKFSKTQLKLRVPYIIWSNRAGSVSISQKMVTLPKTIQSQDSKTTFKQNLPCIFLSVRASLKGNFNVKHPVVFTYICTYEVLGSPPPHYSKSILHSLSLQSLVHL